MRFKLSILLATLLSGNAAAAAPAPVGADHGLVVSAQRIASQVGVDVLKAGGNVVDAAVAVGYALAVAYPAAGNLGGGGFMTIRFADGRTTFLDFREKAPAAATASMFLDADGKVVPGRSTASWLAVGVPGTVAGLEAARARYGTMARDALIAPALALARDGFALTDGDAALLRLARDDFARDAPAAATFLRDGAALAAGDRLVQPRLAATLEAISREGAPAVYGGAVGGRIAAAVAAGGGLVTLQDLRDYRVREFPTVRCGYRGYQVDSAPPPSSGGTTLCEMLGILEGYDLAGFGFHSAAEVHVLAEAARAAYRDRNTVLGDPAFTRNPLDRLLDRSYEARLRAAIPAAGATPDPPAEAPAAEGRQTTHYSVADAAGNAVSVTTTLNAWFGLRRMAGDTGILLNNEMDDFAAKPGAANMFGLVQGQTNAVAPGKTPLSSMSPTVVSRNGRLVLVIGSPGGSRIITAVAEVIVNLMDHGMTLADAIDAPRVHFQGSPDVIDAEPFALSADTKAALARQGYALRESAPWSMAEGILAGAPALSSAPVAGHALEIPDNGPPHALYGAADDRGRTGAAVGY